jgi:hypothetical protein
MRRRIRDFDCLIPSSELYYWHVVAVLSLYAKEKTSSTL